MLGSRKYQLEIFSPSYTTKATNSSTYISKTLSKNTLNKDSSLSRFIKYLQNLPTPTISVLNNPKSHTRF